ncbi:hypothetical protein BC829DRAFT_409370 [Chytridium lagenaria]|nr:hypothetical protein BC829DRAFT_409370 [Chytridium lagenaria]
MHHHHQQHLPNLRLSSPVKTFSNRMPLETHSISLLPLITPRLILTPIIVGPPAPFGSAAGETQLAHVRSNSVPSDELMKRELAPPDNTMQAWLFKFMAAHPDLIPEVDTILYPKHSAPSGGRQRSHSRKMSWPWLFLSTPINAVESPSSPSGTSPPDFVHVPLEADASGSLSYDRIPQLPSGSLGRNSSSSRAGSPSLLSPLNPFDFDTPSSPKTEEPAPVFIGIIELRPPSPSASSPPTSTLCHFLPSLPRLRHSHISAIMDPTHCNNGYSKEALKSVLAHVFRAPMQSDSACMITPSSSPSMSCVTSTKSAHAASMSKPLFFFGGVNESGRPCGRIGIGTLESWSRDTGIGAMAFTPPSRMSSSVALEILDDDEAEEAVIAPAAEDTFSEDGSMLGVLEGLGFSPVKRVACGAAGRFVRRRGYGAVLVRRDWMCWEMERDEFLDLWVG